MKTWLAGATLKRCTFHIPFVDWGQVLTLIWWRLFHCFRGTGSRLFLQNAAPRRILYFLLEFNVSFLQCAFFMNLGFLFRSILLLLTYILLVLLFDPIIFLHLRRDPRGFIYDLLFYELINKYSILFLGHFVQLIYGHLLHSLSEITLASCKRIFFALARQVDSLSIMLCKWRNQIDVVWLYWGCAPKIWTRRAQKGILGLDTEASWQEAFLVGIRWPKGFWRFWVAVEGWVIFLNEPTSCSRLLFRWLLLFARWWHGLLVSDLDILGDFFGYLFGQVLLNVIFYHASKFFIHGWHHSDTLNALLNIFSLAHYIFKLIIASNQLLHTLIL